MPWRSVQGFRSAARTRTAPLTYPDLAQVLQARILADLTARAAVDTPRNRLDRVEGRSAGALKARITVLEKAVADAESLGEQRRQDAETAAHRVKAMEANVAALKEAVIKAEALGEQRRQEAEMAAQRVETLEANVVALNE